MNENWWGWLAVVVIFLIVQAWRVVLRSMTGSGGGGMARLNAAAERILKERAGTASAANPLPRSKPERNQAGIRNPAPTRKPAATRNSAAAAKPRSALLPKSTTPAVIRRNGLLAGSQEAVIQRRR